MSATTEVPTPAVREIPDMHTWAEENGRPPMNWYDFLATDHTEEEWQKASELSQSWVTCACGNQCASIPRANYDQANQCHPIDRILTWLGVRFHWAVCRKEVGKAKRILNAIERRSGQLLSRMRRAA